MKVGDLVWDRFEKRYGILVQKEWETDIGTPFDWLIMYSNGAIDGQDEIRLEVIDEVSN